MLRIGYVGSRETEAITAAAALLLYALLWRRSSTLRHLRMSELIARR